MVIRIALAAAVTILVGAGPLGGTALARSDLDCRDFVVQEDAQAELARDLGDPNRLDADNDGIACEELIRAGTTGTTSPTAPATTPVPVPTRGVDAGVGGGSAPAGFERPLGVGLAVGSLGAAAAVVSRRRRGPAARRRH